MWHTRERGEVFTGFWLGGPKIRIHWEHLGVGGRVNIKLDLREIGIDGANWIQLAQDRGRWRAFVKTGMNLRTYLLIYLLLTPWCKILFDKLSDNQLFK
jgi:hypothetical protein